LPTATARNSFAILKEKREMVFPY